jgi:hypothetical protein
LVQALVLPLLLLSVSQVRLLAAFLFLLLAHRKASPQLARQWVLQVLSLLVRRSSRVQFPQSVLPSEPLALLVV